MMKTQLNNTIQSNAFYVFFCISIAFFSPNYLQAQSEIKTETIYGFISDRGSERPLEYASIELLNIKPSKIAGTDAEGKFELKEVPVGRHRLLISLEGYEDVVMNDLLVESGKRLVIKVALEEKTVVKTISNNKPKGIRLIKSTKDKPINQMSGISARPFTIEEATRYAGARFDPARMVTNYAGAAGYDGSRNDIVVRGNTPSGILWQIEELPVENPNHVATMGVTGGVTPILNVFALDNSDFLTGAYAAQYGNAISGIFDLRLRKGNSEKFGFMGQIGTQRAEILIEGPLNRRWKGSSYLVSVRASTGNYFLKNIVSTDPAHQDVNIKISTGQQRWGELEFFAVAGTSKVWVPYQETTLPDSSKTTIFWNPVQEAFYTKLKYQMFEYDDYLHRSRMGMLGLKYTANLGKRSYFRTIVGATTHQTFYRWTANYVDSTGEVGQRATTFSGDDVRNNYMLHSYINSKLSKNLTLRGGVMANVYDLYLYEVYQLFDLIDFDYDGITYMLRAYAQMRYTVGNFTINAGLSSQYSSMNKQLIAEPRLAINWQFLPRHALSIGYGLHQRQPTYSAMLYQPEIGVDSLGNSIYYKEHYKLKLIGSHHLNAQYDWLISQDFRLKVEGYAQYLFHVPVEVNPSSFSVLNDGADFFDGYYGQLSSSGKGRNWGIELTLEKFYSKGFYSLFSATYFDSKYQGSNGVWFNTKFNNKYIVNLLAGKEFLLGKTKRNTLFTDIRFSTIGGRPYSPIDLQATFNNPLGEEVYYQDQINSKRLKPSYQVDFKVGVRINGNRVAHIFKIDLFNLTALFGVKNPYAVRYSERINLISGTVLGSEQIVYQRGFIPDITYTIQF